jgi:hypothetical protein
VCRGTQTYDEELHLKGFGERWLPASKGREAVVEIVHRSVAPMVRELADRTVRQWRPKCELMS